ncbi:MAG: thiol reductant ABC exporter subunit CydC [Actinomycetota bacterium]|nr:thiol reductant ABC exporter subunit CydC [Actinomycetota bacterium]
MSAPRRDVLQAVLAGTVSAWSSVGLLATSGWLITRAAERPPVLALAVAIGAVQACSLFRGVSRYAERLGIHRCALQRLSASRLALFDALEPRVPGALYPGAGGAVLSAFLSDAEAVSEGWARWSIAAVEVVAGLALALAACLLAAPTTAPLLLGGVLSAVLAALVAEALAGRAATSLASERAVLAATVLEAAAGGAELLVYGSGERVAQRLAAQEARVRAAALRRAAASGAGRLLGAAAAGTALAAILWVGTAAVRGHGLSGPGFAAVTFSCMAVLDAASGLSPALVARRLAGVASGRLVALGELAVPAREPAEPAAAPTRPGALVCADVAIGAGGRTLLEQVNLSLEVGACIGLTGPSGSGKTTLLHVALHLREAEAGSVTLSGTPVAELARVDLARQLVGIGEDPYIFVGTLADNLRLAATAAGDRELLEALGRVGLASWLAGLPDGLATAVGAGGWQVSAGERQRLALARALLSGASVLLLDEPTAHVDPGSCEDLLGALVVAASGRGVLVVAHDLPPSLPLAARLGIANGSLASQDGGGESACAGAAPMTNGDRAGS